MNNSEVSPFQRMRMRNAACVAMACAGAKVVVQELLELEDDPAALGAALGAVYGALFMMYERHCQVERMFGRAVWVFKP